MLGKKEIENAKLETIIGPESKFQGHIKCKGFVRVDGEVEGNISAEGVIVGDKAQVMGDVTAKTVFVGGKIAGNVTASTSLEIQSKGQVFGDIRTGQLHIADGAVFEGNCVMTSEKVALVDAEPVFEKSR